MTKRTNKINWGDSSPGGTALPPINKGGRKQVVKTITNHKAGIQVEQIIFGPDTYIVSTGNDVEYTVTEGADHVLEVTQASDDNHNRSHRIVIKAVEQFRRLTKN